jgi:hypothetical protein
MLLLLLLPLCALSASTTLPLWFMTGGALHDLRRASADGRMEQVLVASLAAPNSADVVRWLAVEKQVAVWSDGLGVRRFDAASALPGQRPTTLLEDRTGRPEVQVGIFLLNETRKFNLWPGGGERFARVCRRRNEWRDTRGAWGECSGRKVGVSEGHFDRRLGGDDCGAQCDQVVLDCVGRRNVEAVLGLCVGRGVCSGA